MVNLPQLPEGLVPEEPTTVTISTPEGEELTLPVPGAEEIELTELGLTPVAALASPEPWIPETLQDLAFCIGRLKNLDQECDEIAAQARRMIQQRQRAKSRFLTRYGSALEAITKEALPTKKDGTPLGKTVRTLLGNASLRRHPGGPKIADPAKLLGFLVKGAGWVPRDLLDAIRISRTETREGLDAAISLGESPEGWGTQLLTAPIRQFIDSGIELIDPDTGEVIDLPGVEIVPPHDVWGYK